MKSAEAKMRADGHTFNAPSPALQKMVTDIRGAMLNEWYAKAPSLGVKDGQAVVKYYEEQYKALSK